MRTINEPEKLRSTVLNKIKLFVDNETGKGKISKKSALNIATNIEKGIFNYSFVEKSLQDHYSGKHDNSQLILRLLITELWFQTFFKNSSLELFEELKNSDIKGEWVVIVKEKEFHGGGVITLDDISELKLPPKQKKFRCALSWQSTNPDTAKAKSINLIDLEDILKIENIEFYSIQYTDVTSEIDEIHNKLGIQIKSIQDLDTKNDLYSVQQLIDSCDFTITVSNSNAHLSAIIGKPTFLLLNNGIGKLW